MTEDEVKTKNKLMLGNYNPLANKTEVLTCDMHNWSYPDYVTEDESNDIKDGFLHNKCDEITEAKNHIIQVLYDRDQIPKIIRQIPINILCIYTTPQCKHC